MTCKAVEQNWFDDWDSNWARYVNEGRVVRLPNGGFEACLTAKQARAEVRALKAAGGDAWIVVLPSGCKAVERNDTALAA